MHDSLKEVSKRIGVEKAGQRVAGLGKRSYRKGGHNFFSAKDDQKSSLRKLASSLED